MKKGFSIFFIILQLMVLSETRGGNGPRQASAGSIGMGGASITLSDSWSIQNNQGALAFNEKLSVGISTQNYFLAGGVQQSNFSFSAPLKNQGIGGLGYSIIGINGFNEQRATFAFSRKFGPAVGLGIGMNLVSVNAGEYGKQRTAIVEAGLLIKLSPSLLSAAHIYNPNRARLNPYNDERIPTVFKIGLQYIASEKVKILADIENDLLNKSRLLAGIQYQPVKAISLRMGLSTQPQVFTFGLGINLQQFSMDLASPYHQVLGPSPAAGFYYQAK